MPIVTPEKLASLQHNAQNIRNLCILAHVDHGKTSLTDTLLATNGIISPKLAGKVRYLDSRPDEQLRGITMESSAISLYFSMLRSPGPGQAPAANEYLINLIDSPGHIDFSSEVSTASRLCDGAAVLVDAVEGVCSQTVTVLRQTWVEELKPVLVINKMDRLITELRMSPSEAFLHVSKIVEQVNAVLGSFFQGERMEEDLNWREKLEARVLATKDRSGDATATAGAAAGDVPDMNDVIQYEERDDEDIYFSPEKNNVIFSSAVDGWAFTIRQFASIYEKKLGLQRGLLEKVLWGNFYLDPKTKKILGPKHLKGRPLKPLFAQLVLEPIWAVYQATTGGDQGRGDPALLEKITKSLQITVPPYVQRSRDPRVLLTTVFSLWLPLSTALLVTVVEYLPSPLAAQAKRMPALLAHAPGGSDAVPAAVRSAMVSLDARPTAPVVAYVSKMVSVRQSELPEYRRKATQMSSEEAREIARRKRAEFARARAADGVEDLTEALDSTTLDSSGGLEGKEEEADGDEEEEDPEHLIGFARIYSGTLSVGDTVYVIPPKWTAADADSAEVVPVEVTSLYMMMGRNLEALPSVPAGCVFGIGGLGGHILKSGTLCGSRDAAVNLAGMNLAGKPIVQVALEPTNPLDLDKMVRGLKLLVQSDPCAEYDMLENGEHVLRTAGELHLERCITDLQERFAKCEVQKGEPIVPYRETAIRVSEMRPPVNPELGRGVVVMPTTSKQVTLSLRVVPLPADVTEFLGRQSDVIKRMEASRRSGHSESSRATTTTTTTTDKETSQDTDEETPATDKATSSDEESAFQTKLQALLDQGRGREVWADVVSQIVAFGPKRIGPNLLIDATPTHCLPKVFSSPASTVDSATVEGERNAASLADKLTYGFQLATGQGPLCQEPVQGMALFVDDVTYALADDPRDDTGAGAKLGRLTSEVIKAVQSAFRAGFLDWSPRLLLAMYSVEIQTGTEILGRVYEVLTRRRGRVVAESMNEGTPFFTIQAQLPVAESFGFADEMRKRTSGAAQPQLIFSGFEVLDEDPFWVPFTDDDLEDLGELADRDNVAKRYMDAVRRKKGLLVEGRHVATDAEKQTTLKR